MVKIKKRPFSVAVGILVILTAILIIAISNKKVNQGEVLYINNDVVTAEEYAMLVEEYSNQVYMQYTTEQVNGEKFWTKKVDGVAPYTLLEDIILEELKENYALKNLAVELGIVEDYTFEDLIESMNVENESKENSSSDEISYGLSSYEISTYYKYWYSNLETQVRNALISEKIDISEDDCKKYYEENKKSYSCEVAVDILYAEIYPDSESKESARNRAYQLSRAMEVIDSVEKLNQEEVFSDITIQELNLTSLDTQEGMSGIYAQRWEIASKMTEGEIYGPYTDNGAYCVIKCVNRVENDIVEFENVVSQIERYLQVEEAKELIDQETKSLKIKEVKKVMKEVILETLD